MTGSNEKKILHSWIEINNYLREDYRTLLVDFSIVHPFSINVDKIKYSI